LPPQCVTTSLDIRARALHVAFIAGFSGAPLRSLFGVAAKMRLSLHTALLVTWPTTRPQYQLTNMLIAITHKLNKAGYIKHAGRN
jgi:hypothetical protein